MIIRGFRIQFNINNINFIIKGSSMFLVNQKSELEPCVAISLEIATHLVRNLTSKTDKLLY